MEREVGRMREQVKKVFGRLWHFFHCEYIKQRKRRKWRKELCCTSHIMPTAVSLGASGIVLLFPFLSSSSFNCFFVFFFLKSSLLKASIIVKSPWFEFWPMTCVNVAAVLYEIQMPQKAAISWKNPFMSHHEWVEICLCSRWLWVLWYSVEHNHKETRPTIKQFSPEIMGNWHICIIYDNHDCFGLWTQIWKKNVLSPTQWRNWKMRLWKLQYCPGRRR